MSAAASTVRTPARSLEQRRQALEKANRVRSVRKQVKQQVRHREVSVVSVLFDPPVELDTMRTIDLLLATPKIGRTKAQAMLRRADVSPSRTVGGLSPRQRRELVGLLTGSRP